MVIIRDKQNGQVRCKIKADTLEACNLRGMNLRYTALASANLRGANLIRTQLWGADLRGANLRGADLAGANLCHADLTDAELFGAKLNGAQYDEETLWPFGFDPILYGAVEADLMPGTIVGPEDVVHQQLHGRGMSPHEWSAARRAMDIPEPKTE